ncbi:glyoxalase [Streptomyces sp. 3MP-14]|uniref:Glyoxalase n=1 Tax=Streptomyces mimosae TaxID=2586635 RepID=A0A5N6AIF5_9ACTN|nr:MULTISPECIES: VOC family protein [Streptomyces]KAB8167843.1 glyoxalase [Streptomyces mimosae]KAB8177509.1 glyoxalase [Streptomyces sp. 3MP-14]
MSTMIFVNLPVKDLERSKEFFTKLGYSFNPQFSDENAACLVISETIYSMLLTEEFFKTFTKKQLADTGTHQEALIGLSADSREAVDELADRALAAGGTAAGDPVDMDGMYGRSFYDLDGHHWEVMWMDPAAVQG